MNQSAFIRMSFDDLLRYERTLKVTSMVMIISVTVIVTCAIIMIGRRGFSSFSILPVIFVPLVFLQIAKLKKVRAEIQKRQANSNA